MFAKYQTFKTEIIKFSPPFFLVACLMTIPELGTNSMVLYYLIDPDLFCCFSRVLFPFEPSISSLSLVPINPLHQAI